MQEDRVFKACFRGSISSSFYIDSNKELTEVFICGVSVTLNVSLVLNGLTARIEVEMGE
jgi:hypothetical protein